VARSLGIDTADDPGWAAELERAVAEGALGGSGNDDPLPGPLDPDELRSVVSALVLESDEVNQDCICAFWDGWTGLAMSAGSPLPQPADDPRGAGGELHEIQDKRYRLTRRPLRDFAEGHVRFLESPDLMWPSDREWFLRSDARLMSSFLGSGSDAVKVLEEPALEAMKLPEDAEVLL
jgi:hypothetical protein